MRGCNPLSLHFLIRLCTYPYQNIRSLVYISRKYAANLLHVCGLYLRRVCRKRVFRMQITFLAHCSDTQCAPQVCSAQLSGTVLAHNVRRKFAAHSCRTLYWHTMCAAILAHNVRRTGKFAAHSCRALYWHTMCAAILAHNVRRTGKFAAHSCRTLFLCATTLRRTVAVHCTVLPTPPHPWVYHPHRHIFLVPYPQGECKKKCGDGRSVTKNKNLGVGVGKNVGAGDGRGYIKNKNLGVGLAVFNPGEGDGDGLI